MPHVKLSILRISPLCVRFSVTNKDTNVTILRIFFLFFSVVDSGGIRVN